MRGGVSHLIYAMSLANINFTTQEKLDLFRVLQENFKHPNIDIQEEATKAFKAFCFAYFNKPNEGDWDQMVKEITNLFKPSMQDDNIAITRGYNMAFGVLSEGMI